MSMDATVENKENHQGNLNIFEGRWRGRESRRVGRCLVETPEDIREAGEGPQSVEIAVSLDPPEVGKAQFDGFFQAGQSGIGLAGERMNAGQVIKQHRLVGLDVPGAPGPGQPFFPLA